MQMVYSAENLDAAHTVCDMLASSGISAHIAEPASEIGPMTVGRVRVSVDNQQLDAARRAIVAWHRQRARSAAR